MLQEVQLFVGRGGPEVVAFVGDLFLGGPTVFTNYGDTAFLPEGGIGQHHVEVGAGGQGQTVPAVHQAFVGAADAVQEQVHGAQPGHAFHDVRAAQGLFLQERGLAVIQGVVLIDEVVGGHQEATSATSRIDDGLTGPWAHTFHHGLNQGPGCEILPRPAFAVLRTPFQQPFIDVPFHIRVQHRPRFSIDHFDDPFQLGRFGDLVLGLAEDSAQQARFPGQVFQGVAVMDIQFVPTFSDQFWPSVICRDAVPLTDFHPFLGHLQEQQEGDLFDIVQVGQPDVPEDVGVVPDFVDDGGAIVGHGRAFTQRD